VIAQYNDDDFGTLDTTGVEHRWGEEGLNEQFAAEVTSSSNPFDSHHD
jgi:hypothetical protein